MIDLRSDTVTKPTPEMRQAMFDALVGDDVYNDDTTTLRLQELAADTLGFEAALFVPSGTMGNQIAIFCHTKRGDEIILAENCHVAAHEVGAAAVLSQVSYSLLEGDVVTAADVHECVREKDVHYPDTGLVLVENALCNGTVVPLDAMKATYGAAKEHGLPVHLDGARVFNAALYLGVEAREVARYADSVMFCLSKGLCSPIGSMLCGSHDFIARAKKCRKLFGGGMRQVGILAACGIISIESMTRRLYIDHENARFLADELAKIPHISIQFPVEINMVFFKIDKPDFNHDAFYAFLSENGIKINPHYKSEYRFVTHNDISRNDLARVLECVGRFVL